MAYVDFEVFESQQMPTGNVKRWASEYRYAGKQDGLHVFIDTANNNKRELFAKRRSVAGWHLERGNWSFEFIRSA